MSAADLLLTVRGQDDRWLSMAPDRTYFEAKYQPRVNRSRETYEIPFDNQDATFGSTGRCTIPVKGDYMTRMTLRTVLPPIYPTVPGQYVYPTPSSEVGATVYVNKTLDLVVADGVTLTANTVGNHYFSIGAQVTLAGTAYVIFDLDGTYTVTSIPTANSFTCSTTLAGISYNGTVSSPGIQCGDIISYFSTTNSNLWVNNVTNKTWQITGGTRIGSQMTFTTSAPSNFPTGSQIVLNLPYIVSSVRTINSSTDSTFTVNNGGVFVMDGQIFSLDDGLTFQDSFSQYNKYNSVAFGNGTFVAVTQDSSVSSVIGYSTNNGLAMTTITVSSLLRCVTFGNGTFVAIGVNDYGYSTDNGQTWTTGSLGPIFIPNSTGFVSVAYGNGTFVAVANGKTARSTDNGQTWTTGSISGDFSNRNSLTFGNGTFVAVGNGVTARSTNNGITWTTGSISGNFDGVAFGNGTFVSSGYYIAGYSTDNGLTWTLVAGPLQNTKGMVFANGNFYTAGSYLTCSRDNGKNWSTITYLRYMYYSIAFGYYNYVSDPSNSVSLVVPPLQLTNRSFSSDVYPSISFATAADAAFWGFDSREGLTYSLPATPPWTLTQSGWISGFLPPSTSTYDDSVAHKLCKSIRLLVGKQTIKEYSGEYIELQNDLLVPYENKAILKLMNGTLDQTQATVAREYYVNLPLGTKEVPLCALTHQNMSVEVDFDSYLNLSQNLNQGTGDFLNAKSYTTYDASTGLLGGQPVNVQTTFSYQQYIFIVTYGGQFIIFDTTKNVDDPTSYIVLSAFSGSNLFKQFCVLSGNLYIGLTNGTLARMIITELIQGNISSFLVNNYVPTVGSLTGTIVADFRYVYYTVSNTASSNVFMTKYDTTGTFTSPSSYTTVDFTKTFNSSVTGVYQTLSTGTQLVLLPRGTPGSLYTYQLNANVQSQWYTLDYSAYGPLITSGTIINNVIYFISGNIGILKYYNNQFTFFSLPVYPPILVTIGALYNPNTGGFDDAEAISTNNGYAWTYKTPFPGSRRVIIYANGIFVLNTGSNQAYSVDGVTWTASTVSCAGGGLAFGNGTFVMMQAYSTDNARTWTPVASPISTDASSIAFGNNTFVAIGSNSQVYSTDNGRTWTFAATPIPPNGSWVSVAFGNGVFVAVGFYPGIQYYSDDNGRTWKLATTVIPDYWSCVTFGNGSFVMAGWGAGAAYSTDGRNWTRSPLSGSITWEGITFIRDTFYVTGIYNQAFSIDNGVSWTISPGSLPGNWLSIAGSDPIQTFSGSFTNILAVGNYIYASTNNVAVRIDTTQDLSTAAAYTFPAPLPVGQYVFANGPRYIYMFAQGDNAATNIVEFDPYGPDTTFKASILVDYESLPPEVPKPDKALLGLVQTQKVTDMNYMNIKGPVKELWVTGPSATTNVFQYSNLAPRSSLALTGEKIVTEDEGTHTFLNIIEPFETHTSMPIRNVSVVAFELDPESEIPNGTINFSRIRDQVFEGGAQTVWARNYNLLAIQGGIGGLIFNS